MGSRARVDLRRNKADEAVDQVRSCRCKYGFWKKEHGEADWRAGMGYQEGERGRTIKIQPSVLRKQMKVDRTSRKQTRWGRGVW